MMRTMCYFCNHFIEENDGAEKGQAKYVHLDDGDKDHDHDAQPGMSNPVSWWKRELSHLFKEYPDGKVGPNSVHFDAFNPLDPRRGWSEDPRRRPRRFPKIGDNVQFATIMINGGKPMPGIVCAVELDKGFYPLLTVRVFNADFSHFPEGKDSILREAECVNNETVNNTGHTRCWLIN